MKTEKSLVKKLGTLDPKTPEASMLRLRLIKLYVKKYTKKRR
jgi:hypothetical protein